jgi:exonuclease SbcC
MIEQLDIQNFQSHKNTTINFSKGVNTIIGPSDSGKTAIIRALKWVTWNRPLGDAFVRHGEDDCTVMIRNSEGQVVERYKGTKDHYAVHAGGDTTKFEAFGKEPPEEIFQCLEFDEINLQSQMDSSFLISSNPGEVARHFNRIANIDKIDSSLKSVESWVRKLTQDIRANKEEIERLEVELGTFEDLDKAEQRLEVLEGLVSQKSQIKSKIRSVESLLEDLEEIEVKKVDYKTTASYADDVDYLIELYNTHSTKFKELQEFENAFKKLVQCLKDIKKLKGITTYEEQVNEILRLIEQQSDAEDKVTELVTAVKNFKAVQKDIETTADHITKLETTWKDEMPDTCPLCDQEVQ